MLFSMAFADAAAPAEVNPSTSLLFTLIPLAVIIAAIIVVTAKITRSRLTKKQENMSITQASPEEIKKLAKLKQDGALSDEEFEEAKKKILNQ